MMYLYEKVREEQYYDLQREMAKNRRLAHRLCGRAGDRPEFQRRYVDFRYFAFLIALGYLASYVGYLIVPARGPRFLLRDLQHTPLQGLWLFEGMQKTLNQLESAHYDCFPSGHTELTILAWWSTRRSISRLFWPYFAYTISIIFATVYLRYHYTVDVLAGVAVATSLILAAPLLYRYLAGRRG